MDAGMAAFIGAIVGSVITGAVVVWATRMNNKSNERQQLNQLVLELAKSEHQMQFTQSPEDKATKPIAYYIPTANEAVLNFVGKGILTPGHIEAGYIWIDRASAMSRSAFRKHYTSWDKS